MTLMPDSSDNHSTISADMPSAGRLLSDPPGVVLKRARQARKLDLETAADQLNLSASVVKALEEDAYDSLPSATFVRGYIRCYARLLKLSGDDLVRSYERVTAALQPEPQESAEGITKAPPKIKKGWIGLALLLIVVAVVLGVFILPTGQEIEQGPVDSGPVGQSADVQSSDVQSIDLQSTAAPSLTIQKKATQTTVTQQVAEQEQVANVTNTTVTEVQPKPTVSEQPEPEPEPTIELEIEPSPSPVQPEERVLPGGEAVTSSLTMRFSGECWVEVWDATGKRLYANLRKAGQKVTLEGVPPIDVKLGNGAVVQLEFDGSPVLFASSKRTSVAHVTLGAQR